MEVIIKHGIYAPLKSKSKDVTFRCNRCGCVFKTGSYICFEIGHFGFSKIYSNCPECLDNTKAGKIIRTSFILKQTRGD